MNASRVRNGAIILALIFLIGAVANSPAVRPALRRAAVSIGLIAPVRPARVGSPMVPVALETLDGASFTLDDRNKRALLINVFTSWCPSCNVEMPALSRAAPGLSRQGIDVVGIDQGESGEQVARFVQNYDVRYPVYIDPDLTTDFRLGARVIPTTLFVDRDGVIRYVHSGPLDVTAFLSLARTFN